MSEGKRGRGRPKGMGCDDALNLERLADFLLNNPETMITRAIREVIPGANDATIRRILRKWKIAKSEHIERAKARLQPKRDVMRVNPSELISKSVFQGNHEKHGDFTRFLGVMELQGNSISEAIAKMTRFDRINNAPSVAKVLSGSASLASRLSTAGFVHKSFIEAMEVQSKLGIAEHISRKLSVADEAARAYQNAIAKLTR